MRQRSMILSLSNTFTVLLSYKARQGAQSVPLIGFTAVIRSSMGFAVLTLPGLILHRYNCVLGLAMLTPSYRLPFPAQAAARV